jgi:alcohol dehydrogenase class IV
MTAKKGLKFDFSIPTRVVCGESAATGASKFLQELGAQRALVVTDRGLKDSPVLNEVVDSLGESCAGVFAEVTPDPELQIIARGAETGKKCRADGILSVGGGSSMDTAKCIAVLLKKNSQDILEFVGFRKVKDKALPHIAIPTTAGTGSEVTSFALVRSAEEHKKHLVADPGIIPPIAILDPKMTISLPQEITAATGADALSHAIESLYCVLSGPLSDGLAWQAAELIIQNLPRCVKDGTDIEARGRQLAASCMAGMAFQNALVGVVHAFAHAVGGLFGVPHGIANAIFLPYGLEFNAETSGSTYEKLARLFGLNPEGKNQLQLAEELMHALRSFLAGLGLPGRLSEVGIQENQLEACAEQAFKDPAMLSNPRRIDNPEPLLQILRKAF